MNYRLSFLRSLWTKVVAFLSTGVHSENLQELTWYDPTSQESQPMAKMISIYMKWEERCNLFASLESTILNQMFHNYVKVSLSIILSWAELWNRQTPAFRSVTYFWLIFNLVVVEMNDSISDWLNVNVELTIIALKLEPTRWSSSCKKK